LRHRFTPATSKGHLLRIGEADAPLATASRFAIANTRGELLEFDGLSGPSGSPVLVVVRVQMEDVVAESVYKIIEIVGTSPTSWEKAAAAAVERAAQTLRDLRIAEVCEQDIVITDGKIEAYRVRVKISFKYED
jgi:flavin-binding protein dodecin